MWNLYQVENRKFRHCIWKVFFFLIPVIPTVIGTINYQMNLEILKCGWFDLWTQHTLFYAFFFFSPMIAIAASFLWRVEHKGKNWNLFMTSPVDIGKLYAAKGLVLVKMVVEIQIWVGLLFFTSAKLIGLEGTIPPQIIWWLIRGTFGALVIAAIQMAVSMMIQNFAVPVMVGFMGGISGFLFSSYGYGVYYPYSQLMMGMNSNKVEDVLEQGNTVFFGVVIFYVIVFFALGVLYLKKADVKTQ